MIQEGVIGLNRAVEKWLFQKMPNFGGVDLTAMGDAGHNMNPFHFWAPEFKSAGVRLVDHDDDALAALGPASERIRRRGSGSGRRRGTRS